MVDSVSSTKAATSISYSGASEITEVKKAAERYEQADKKMRDAIKSGDKSRMYEAGRDLDNAELELSGVSYAQKKGHELKMLIIKNTYGGG